MKTVTRPISFIFTFLWWSHWTFCQDK